eukprot:SAG31_NODE_63_length_28659_cov_23.074685_5_plen_70_part_00
MAGADVPRGDERQQLRGALPAADDPQAAEVRGDWIPHVRLRWDQWLGKGCYSLVFVPTIREIRDFYREM